MPRSLADGKTKFTILTSKPANPQAPTAQELNGGLDASCNVLASDFSFGAAVSDKINEGALCETSNAQTSTRSNFVCGFTVFRYFDSTTGASNTTEGDDIFQAVKAKGTTLYAYGRRTPAESTDAWVDGEEIFLGAEISTDNLTPPSEMGGWIKWRQDADVQAGWPNLTVGGGSSSSSSS